MKFLISLLIGICSTSGITDLGVLSKDTALVLELSTNHAGFVGFEIKLYPSGVITNGYSFKQTNTVLLVEDLPMEIPEGFIVMSVSPVYSLPRESESMMYSFWLIRPVIVRARLVEISRPTSDLPPLPPESPRRAMAAPPPLPTDSTAAEDYVPAMIKFYSQQRRGR